MCWSAYSPYLGAVRHEKAKAFSYYHLDFLYKNSCMPIDSKVLPSFQTKHGKKLFPWGELQQQTVLWDVPATCCRQRKTKDPKQTRIPSKGKWRRCRENGQSNCGDWSINPLRLEISPKGTNQRYSRLNIYLEGIKDQATRTPRVPSSISRASSGIVHVPSIPLLHAMTNPIVSRHARMPTKELVMSRTWICLFSRGWNDFMWLGPGSLKEGHLQVGPGIMEMSCCLYRSSTYLPWASYRWPNFEISLNNPAYLKLILICDHFFPSQGPHFLVLC